MSEERTPDVGTPETRETEGHYEEPGMGTVGTTGGTGSTSGTGAGGGGLGSAIGLTGDQGATPGMGTGEADTSAGTDAGTGDVGEGGNPAATRGEPGGTVRNADEELREPASGTD
jgi:hypothetical protein